MSVETVPAPSPAVAGDEPEDKAERLRRELDVLLGELKNRGRRAFDLRHQLHQLRQHPAVVAGAGAVLLAGIGLGVAHLVRRQQRKHSLGARLQALGSLVQERAAAGVKAARTGGTSKRRQAKQEDGGLPVQLLRAALALALPRIIPLVIGKVMDSRKEVSRRRPLALALANDAEAPSRSL